MKTKPAEILSVALIAIPMLLGGCSGGGTKVSKDTTAFDKAFKSSPADVQAAAAKASAAFKAEKLLEAVDALAEIARKGGLAQEQKDIIIDMVVKIQTIMSLNPDKQDIRVHQSVENVTAALEGRAPVVVGIRRN